MSLPTYSEAVVPPDYAEYPSTEEEVELAKERIQLYLATVASLKTESPPQPIDRYPRPILEPLDGDIQKAEQEIVPHFFAAISKKNVEVVAIYLQSNVVTANTTYDERTPLVGAIDRKDMPIVRLLLESGADPNALALFSIGWDHSTGAIRTFRTPLQAAAASGHLPLVKLLMETYRCDDSVVAPDGQIALRLAAENGHREVVDYLPARRAGGYRRWLTRHQVAIRRINATLRKIRAFLKFFLWDIWKFFVWTVPKNVIVKPLVKNCKWAWENRKSFAPWCKHQLRQTSARLKRCGLAAWKGIKATPKAIKDTAKYVREHLPAFLKRRAQRLWEFFTKKLPRGIATFAKWVYEGLLAVGRALGRSTMLFVSLLHTSLMAVVSFFRSLTLRDIWNGFCALLQNIFVEFPKSMWSWMLKLNEVSLQTLRALFGGLGTVLWAVVNILGAIALYLPKKMGDIVRDLGGSMARAWYEIVVWLNPKA